MLQLSFLPNPQRAAEDGGGTRCLGHRVSHTSSASERSAELNWRDRITS